MSLLEYYKKHIFEYGFSTAFNNRREELDKWAEKSEAETNSIYFRDELDYYTCADYYGSYIGGKEDWTQEDIDFLSVLGFSPEDFEEEGA